MELSVSLIKNKGFSLVEVLVSIFIFSIVLLGLNYSLILTMDKNMGNFLRNAAVKINQSHMDKLRSMQVIAPSTYSSCDLSDNNPNRIIDYVRFKNATIKFETIWNVNEVPIGSGLYEVTTTTCYQLKNTIKTVIATSKIKSGKSGL